MRVFMVTKPISPYWDEGSKNLAFNIAKRIKDIEFDMLTVKNVKLPKIDNITYHCFYPINALNLPKIGFIEKFKLFFKVFTKKDVDIYHFIFTPRLSSSLVADIFFSFSKKKSIQTISTPLKITQLRKCLFADKIIVLSDWSKKRILKLGYNNVVKINPGIDLDKFSPSNIKDVRKKLGLQKDDTVILFPSEYSPSRGTRIFLRIIKNLIDYSPKVKIIFACRIRGKEDKIEKKFLIEEVRNLGMEREVTFLDRIDFMPELIRSSDIVVFPSLSPFLKMEIPMVLLEALALQRPIVITDIPPLNEIFIDTEAGIKIKPGDSKLLLEGIIKLIKNKNLRIRMGKAGRKIIEREYNIVKIAEDYLKVYRELKR